jgi:hypothetical protein
MEWGSRREKNATVKCEMSEEDLLEFYGTECVHCKEMEPLIERLEAEEKIAITRLEVWHNEKNAALLRQLDPGHCGGGSHSSTTRRPGSGSVGPSIMRPSGNGPWGSRAMR